VDKYCKLSFNIESLLLGREAELVLRNSVAPRRADKCQEHVKRDQ
jgi:hypothetical protein